MIERIALVRHAIFCNRATAAVEFAIMAPIFIAMLFGIIAYGSYFAMVNGVQQLAAEAARASVAGLSDGERGSLALAYVTCNVSSYPFLSGVRLTTNAGPSPGNPNTYVVTLSYDASGTLVYTFASLIPAPTPLIIRSAAIPRGGY